MGPPSFHESRNRWTVFVAHSDGMIMGYEIEGETVRTRISRDDYLDRLGRQQVEEKAR